MPKEKDLSLSKIELTPKIAVIGAGYVGLCTGAILSEAGYEITFLDIDKDRIYSLKQGRSPVFEPGLDDIISKGVSCGMISATTKYEVLSSSDIFILAVNTPINEQYEVNLSYLKKACESLANVIKRGSIVISRSTVPPLTIRNEIIPIFKNKGFRPDLDLYFAVIPERLSEGHALVDMRSNPIIIGAETDLSFSKVAQIWKFLRLEIIRVSFEEAELTKLTDNLWIDLNIALANEIALVAEKVGADARRVISAANTLKKGMGNVNILMPGIGVGGSCLPKDPHILNSFAHSIGIDLKLPKSSRSVNDSMPVHMFNLIVENLGTGVHQKILLLGLSFNSNSGDMRYSPSIRLNRELISAGLTVYGYDPLVDQKDLSIMNGLKVLKTKEEFFSALTTIDAVAVVAAHDVFKEIKPEILQMMKNKLIVDGRYLFEPQEAIQEGVNYKAVGVGKK